VKESVELRKEQNQEGMTTFLELSDFKALSEDVDEVAYSLNELVMFLEQGEQDEEEHIENHESLWNASSKNLVISRLQSSVLSRHTGNDNIANDPNLMAMYDGMVELFISCLPRKTPGPARLAKERLARRIATELYLSSLAVSLRAGPSPKSNIREDSRTVEFELPVRRKGELASQISLQVHSTSLRGASEPATTLPTPASTPSLASRASNASIGEPEDSNAVLRLRAYATTIKSQPQLNPNKSIILSHWPSIPGSSPAHYSWEATRKALASQNGLQNEEDTFAQEEEARRRRRTEKFLKRHKGEVEGPTSQPTPTVLFGSDPVQMPASSQVVEDIPMTQPVVGAFGSRQGQQKKKKKRKAAGFR